MDGFGFHRPLTLSGGRRRQELASDRSIKAIEYDSHRCTESVTRQEMQLVSKVVHKMLDASKENIIQINTGGTVSK